MEKIAINLVGGVAGDAGYGLRLYNVGKGFIGVTGRIVSRVADSMFLNITAERRYTVAVEGDLVLSSETDDSYVSKTNEVYGFDIDWSDTARSFGKGSGKIIMTNPDSPNDISVFEVFMGDTRSAVVEFKPDNGNYGSAIIRDELDVSDIDPVMKKVLSAPHYDNPYACGIALVTALLPALGFDYGRLFDINVHRTEDSMSNPKNTENDRVVELLIVDGPTTPVAALQTLLEGDVPVLVVGDTNMPSDDARVDVLVIGDMHAHAFCAHNQAGDCALVDALIGGLAKLPDGLERASLADLMDSYGDNDGAKIGGDKRDFGQLARTRQHDIDGIARAVAAADALGIDTSDIASKRDELLAKLAVFSDRFEVGGTHEVTTDEAAVINTVFGELFGIHQELDTCVSHWHHYKQQIEATQNHWAEGLASRKRNVRLADDSQDNRIATSYVDYAAKPEETLETSKTALVELFQAIQRRDLRAAHEAANKARQFGTREHFLASLIRRGVLVPVEESAAA